MGLFRIAFLLLAIAAGACIALVDIAPSAFHARTAEAANGRLRTATMLAATLEEKANQERLRFATEFATSSLLTLAVSPSTDAEGVATPPTKERIAQGYREAARAFLSDTRQNYDLVAMFDANGGRIDSTSVVTTVASEDFAAPGRVREVGTTGRPLGAIVAISGRIFGVAAVPIRSSSGVVGGVLLVAEEYGDALVAERRQQLGFPLALHVDHDIVVHDLTDPTLFSTANGTVMKLEKGKWPAAGKGEATTRNANGRTIFASTAALATDDAAAAFRSDVGVALLFDAPAMNSNLLALLVESGSFDEIPGAAIAAVAGSLMFFFLGLLLLDMEQRGPARRLAKDVSGLMTTNHPAPLDVSKYGPHLRSLVSSINEFIESRKTFVATKRTKHDTASREAVPADAAADSGQPSKPVATPVATPLTMMELELEPVEAEVPWSREVTPAAAVAVAAPPAPVVERARPSGAPAVLPPPVDLEEFLPLATPSTQPNPAVEGQQALEALADRDSGNAPAMNAPVAVSLRPATMNEPLSEELLAQLLSAADGVESKAEAPVPDPPKATAEEVTRDVLADELQEAAEEALRPAASPLSLEAKLQSMQGGGFMTGNFASVSGSFPGVSGSYPSVMGARAALDPEFRGLFESYQTARKACGESTEKHTHAKFLERVLKNRDEIMAKTGCKDVSFEVIIKEGKASLKATPIR